MPTHYRILLSASVDRNLEEIFDYIAARSPQNAAAVIRRILNAIDGLETFPHRGEVTVQPRAPGLTVRSIAIQSWIVLFEVDDRRKAVRVLQVYHGARRRHEGN